MSRDLSRATGVLWWPTDQPTVTVGLVVQAGTIVDAVPDWATEGIAGRAVRKVWMSGVARGLHLRWAPDVEPFHPWSVHGKTYVQRWRYRADGVPGCDHQLTLGRLPDGRWWIESTAERRTGCAWIYPDETSARAEVEHRLAVNPDRWTDIGFPVAPHQQPAR